MSKKETKKPNTLLNYFKSPKSVTPKSEKSSAVKKPEPTTPTRAPRGRGKVKGKENKEKEETKPASRKRPLKPKTPEKSEDDEDEGKDEEEEEVAAQKPKRRRIIIPDEDSEGCEDSEDDYVPDDSEASETDETEGCTESDIATGTETEEDTPQKKRARTSLKPSNGNTSRFGKERSKKPSKEESFVLKKAPSVSGPASGAESWPHLTLDFLQPDKRRDAKGRRPTDEDYDPGTVRVPQDFLEKQTPAMRQWWELKSKHFDCVLFFKVGKFYELYHMDAVISANELGISYMRGEWAHSGFPEIAYGRFAGMLVEKGYKVARIEQTENPEMMHDRIKNTKAKTTKFDKVVKREICQVSTRGTRVITAQDPEIITPHSNYLLSIFEKTDSAKKIPMFGVCFIDTTIGEFHLGQFEDDPAYSRLLTLVSHYQPIHVVFERGNLSPGTLRIVNTLLASARKDALIKDTQFWTASRCLKELHEGDYFKDESGGNFQWPEGLKPYLNPADSLGLSPADDKELAVKALGGCVYLLKDFVLDQQIISQKHFQTYVPPDASFADKKKENSPPVSNMVLDAITINNLRILGDDMSLLKTLDQCCTAFGKRLLKEWVCRPSCRKNVIVSRQEAITELLDHPDIVQEVRKILSHMPDLERLLSKIHTHGSVQKMKNHPDGRAFMFESKTYSKRKIVDFTTALEGFENVLKIVGKFGMCECALLKRITQEEPEGDFPELRETLDFFKNAFDHEEAKKEGSIVPKKGLDAEYDSLLQEFDAIKKDGNDYLKKQQSYFGGKVTFTGSEKKRFQLEVPMAHANKAGSSYELQGQRKGFKKYYTEECREFLARQMKAEEQKESVLKDLNRRIFAKFSDKFDLWSSAVYKIAMLDVLIAFAEYAKSGEMCVPDIVDEENDGYTMIKDGKHPAILSENFVPNDTHISTEDHASVVIVTGPNMGGKSTLMRQVGLITVMAQMGCHVPASECKLSLVDRIFTRLGASDDLLTGRSTFLIELSETATILRHATRKSLVLLDELGRGTSTYDGTAIAAAVVDALTKLKCRTLFSTHYHSLVEDFKKNSEVSLAHMACQVEAETEEDISEETVTFLYKLTPGACPKSYGFNAARLAGIPMGITKRARQVADQFEKEANQRNFFASLCRASEVGGIKDIISKLKTTVLI